MSLRMSNSKNDTKTKVSIIRNIISLWLYLGKGRGSRFALLLALTLMAMFAEVISIGAVIPFLTALTAPETLLKSSSMQHVWGYFGISRADDQPPKIT